MKRLIVLFAMVFGFMFQSKATDLSTIIDSTKQFVTEIKDSAVAKVSQVDTSSTFKLMYSDFKQGIVALASSLKVGAEHVYGVLVKQQIVYGVVYLFIFLLGIYLTINWLKNYKNKDEEWTTPPPNSYSSSDVTGLGVFRTIQIIVATVLLGIGIFNIDNIMTGFINPEYGAIQDVIEMVKDNQKAVK